MIWVELLSRHREVVARYRVDGDSATIGRAYDNDVVVDDPYVAAHHVNVARDAEGRLVAHDLGSLNGLYAGDEATRQIRIALDGERLLRIGRTLVRVRDAAYAVPPERIAGAAPARDWPLSMTLALALVVAGLSALTLWLSETTEPQLSRYVLPLFAMAVLILLWTTAWAVMSRIFSGAARFDRHLAIALGGIIAFFVFDEITDYGSFALSWRGLADYAYAGSWLLLAALCIVHLRAIGPGRLQFKAGVVVTLALLAIGAQTLTKSELSTMFGQQSYLPGLKPPAFRLKPPKSEGEFFAGVDALKAAVDKARRDPVETPGLLPDNDEER